MAEPQGLGQGARGRARDPGLEAPPAVGIYRAWGSGKTGVMKLLRARIEQKSGPGGRRAQHAEVRPLLLQLSVTGMRFLRCFQTPHQPMPDRMLPRGEGTDNGIAYLLALKGR